VRFDEAHDAVAMLLDNLARRLLQQGAMARRLDLEQGWNSTHGLLDL
jgi:hypothetical protein